MCWRNVYLPACQFLFVPNEIMWCGRLEIHAAPRFKIYATLGHVAWMGAVTVYCALIYLLVDFNHLGFIHENLLLLDYVTKHLFDKLRTHYPFPVFLFGSSFVSISSAPAFHFKLTHYQSCLPASFAQSQKGGISRVIVVLCRMSCLSFWMIWSSASCSYSSARFLTLQS